MRKSGNMKHVINSTVDEEVFHSVMEHYQKWDEWKKSSSCFLSKKELLAVEYYQRYYAYRAAALELDVFVSDIQDDYGAVVVRALNKLENYFEYYQRWMNRT